MKKPQIDPATERLERDQAFMRNPNNWPLRPVLPLKKRTGSFHDADYCGFLLDGAGPVVFLGLIHAIPAAGPGDLPQRRYETMEALAADYAVD